MSAGDRWLAAAEERLRSAKMLRKQSRRDLVLIYFLSGHAIELALWAYWLQKNNANLPDYRGGRYHDLKILAEHCGLWDQIREEVASKSESGKNWLVVKDWDSNARFPTRSISAADANGMYQAAARNQGVMEWLKNRYHQI